MSLVIGIASGPKAGSANNFLWCVYDRAFGRFGDRIDRKSRARGDLIFRGFFFTIIFLCIALALSHVVQSMTAISSGLNIILLTLTLSIGALWRTALNIFNALSNKEAPSDGAYLMLSRSTRTDLNTTDDYGIVRETLAFLAIGLDKQIVAPSLWYLIGGMPALLIYNALSFLAWRYGKNGFTKGFGSLPLALEKLLGFIPSLFTGLLLSMASAITPTARLHKALISWWSAKGKAPYEQGGAVISALAWPLEVSLGGAVRDVSGSDLPKQWVGPEGASAKTDAQHLKRGLYMVFVAYVIFIVALLFAYIYAGKFF